ncbi:MAG: geranylgeranylglyceryl/heptaprenylglyceryl phosphate synthase [Acidobacteriota bacterium]
MTHHGTMLDAARRTSVLERLRAHRPSILHAIDPFKVKLDQAVEKARALEELGFPAVILASTDWEDFDAVVDRFIDEIRAATHDLPILLHFPPRLGYGMPMVGAADATMYPFLLGSTDPYFAWQSYAETVQCLTDDPRRRPAREILHLAALTFGTDQPSHEVMALEPIESTRVRAERLLEMIEILGLQGAYLFSRYEMVPPSVCRIFREQMPSDKILFASGGVREPERAHQFFDAGVDFVVFCGALERPDWRPVLEALAAGAPVAGIPAAPRTLAVAR